MASRKRRIRNPHGCINCGRRCEVDCVDNLGHPYKGCAYCVVSLVALPKEGTDR